MVQNDMVETRPSPYTLLLGVAQDGGYPQAGCRAACCAPAWAEPERRGRAVSLGIADPLTGERWLIDASPDLPAQLRDLDESLGTDASMPVLSGVLLTHGHIGHYTGLMYLGRESMGARNLPVYGMSRMLRFLQEHGPWEQLCDLQNIALQPLDTGQTLALNDRIRVRPFLVPHRGEYTETVGMVVSGPTRKVLYLPDIDQWDRNPSPIEALLEEVDCAYIDGTFFDWNELPHRNREEIPHPMVVDSLKRFAGLNSKVRARIHFFHFNHSNPLWHPNSDARKRVQKAGMKWAQRGMKEAL